MELNKFLQEDIIEFLNQKSSEQREKKGLLRTEEFSLFSLDKDFAKETEEAIKNNDLGKAKSIFDQLKEAYELNKGKEEQEKIHAVLEEVYEKIKQSMQTKKTLEEELQEFAAKGIVHENLEAKEARMQKTIDAINKALEQKNINVAIQNYNDLKAQFTKFPTDDKERKIKWYNELITAFEIIKRTQQKIQKKVKQKQEEHNTTTKKKDANIEDAKQHIKQLVTNLEKNDTQQSRGALIDARHRVAKISNEFSKEKKELEAILNTITHRIEFIARQEHRKETALPEDPTNKKELPKPEKPKITKPEQKKEKSPPNKKIETPKQEKKDEKPTRKILEHNKEVHIKETKNTEELYTEALKLQHSGKEAEAIKLYEQIIKQSPNNMRVRIRLEQLRTRGKT